MEVSRRKLTAIIGVVLIVAMGISAYSSVTTFVPCRMTMYADPALDISLAQFQECACITPFTSYDWDGVVEGEHYQCPVYVKNTGTVSLLITYLPTDLWFLEDQAHFIITCYVIEFGLPCELYPLDTPIQLPEKDPANCTMGFYLPPGKVIKVDIVLYIDRIVVGETYEWEFTFWGKVPCEAPRPAELVLDKFNDLNDNGVYDAGDVKIADWRIDVTDPLGVTTTYLTPKALEITDFGTYIITEDLPAEWEQTAVRVDGVYITPPTATVTVLINEGEEHHVLYGNREIPPPPARLIIEKFNDTNRNGVFDGDDVMITGWETTVTDPDGVPTTHSTKVILDDITNFGTYTVTEELRDGWEQIAVRVDGVYIDPPTLTVTVEINAGEEHSVLYGNREIPATPATIRLFVSPPLPYNVSPGGTEAFDWEVTFLTTPVLVTLEVKDPDGVVVYTNSWDVTGETSPITGSDSWDVPLGAELGYYTATVSYYSLEIGPTIPEATASRVFEVA